MNCEQQEWIDLYLFGELEGEELLCFERKMQEDADFREEVGLQEEIFLGIRSYCATKSDAGKSKIINLSFRKVWVSIAAAVIFVSMATVLLQNDLDKQQENAQYTHNDYHLRDYGIIAPFKDKFVSPHLPSWVIKPLPELI